MSAQARRGLSAEMPMLILAGGALAAAGLAEGVRLAHGVGSPVLAAVGTVGSIGLGSAAGLWMRRQGSFPKRATRVVNALVAGDRQVQLRESQHEGWVWELAWQVPVEVNLETLMSRGDAMGYQLDAAVELWAERSLLRMRASTHPIPGHVEYQGFYTGQAGTGELPFGLGIGREGSLWADLAALPHLLFAGATGGGKSAFLRQMLTHLVRANGPDRLTLALADLKGVGLNLFEGLPHLDADLPIARTPETYLQMLQVLTKAMAQRQDAFARRGIEDVQEWNGHYPSERLPYVVHVLDEAARAADSSQGKEILPLLAELAQLGRALGFHLVLGTQRPDADVLPGQIKANMPARVAFSVDSGVNSRIVLGEENSSAAKIRPHPGRGIWQWRKAQEFQGIWLEKEEARAVLPSRRSTPTPIPSMGGSK